MALHAGLADAQYVPLNLVHQRVQLAFIVIHPRHHVGARVDHFAQQVFLLHNIQVIPEIGRGRHRVRQRGQVGNAPDLFQQLLILEPLLQGDDVNRLPAIVHLRQDREDRLMAQVVEYLIPALELLDALPHAVIGRQQHAAEHPLLCFRRMRRQPVHPPGIGGGRLSTRRPFQIWRRARAF